MSQRSTYYEPLFQIQPTGGLNSEDNESMVADQEVTQSANFLFDRQQAATRPAATPVSLSGTTGSESIGWAARALFGGEPYGNTATIALGVGGTHLYSFLGSSRVVSAALTGPAINQGANWDPASLGWGVVNAVMLVGGINSSGASLLRWDPTTTAYTKIASVAPNYIAGLYSRAVGANDPTAATYGQLTVEWSVAGDETTWTGSTNGSGVAVLSDAADNITGTGVVNGTWVIPRSTGFHLGIVTGQAFPAFRFVNYNGSGGIGCFYPNTFCIYNNICYFVGQDNVYTFDTINPPVPIGYKIRSLLLNALLNNTFNVKYVGFVSGGNNSTGIGFTNPERLRYNLVPVTTPLANIASAGFPHFTYDILTGVWSVHFYSTSWCWALAGGFQQFNLSAITFLPAFSLAASSCSRWDETSPCEANASFTTKSFRPGQYDRDYTLQRLLMSFRNQPTNVTLTAKGRLNNTLVSHTQNYTPSVSSDMGWLRDWFDGLRDTYGQDFTLTVATLAGTAFATDYIGIEFVESGGMRGF